MPVIKNNTARMFIFTRPGGAQLVVPPGESECSAEDLTAMRANVSLHPSFVMGELAEVEGKDVATPLHHTIADQSEADALAQVEATSSIADLQKLQADAKRPTVVDAINERINALLAPPEPEPAPQKRGPGRPRKEG